MEHLTAVLIDLANAFLLTVLFSMAEGLYYHMKEKKAPFNEHRIWLGIRLMVFYPMFLSWFDMFQWWTVIGFVGFSYFFVSIHDSFYYWYRNVLNPEKYKRGFKDVSHNSTAYWDRTFGAPAWNTRVVMFFVGLFLLFGMFGGMFS